MLLNEAFSTSEHYDEEVYFAYQNEDFIKKQKKQAQQKRSMTQKKINLGNKFENGIKESRPEIQNRRMDPQSSLKANDFEKQVE